MSIKPIDLQTLFLKMNQVGKEQAQTRAAVQHSQELQAEKILRMDEHRDHSVNEVDTQDEESSKINKDGGEAQNQGSSHKGDRNAEDGSGKEEGQKNPKYKDPLLGQKIDLEG